MVKVALDKLSSDFPIQYLGPNPNYFKSLIGMDKIGCFDRFRRNLTCCVLFPQLRDKAEAKAALLHSIHLIADHWQGDREKNSKDYAACFTHLGSLFLKLEEPELARDCQFLALNIGYTNEALVREDPDFIREDIHSNENTHSKRTAMCRLVHIYKAFPRLLEQESVPATEFIDALGAREGLFSLLNKTVCLDKGMERELSVEEVYAALQGACREMRRDPAELEVSWSQVLKAFLFFNNIGKKLPIDIDAFQLKAEMGHLEPFIQSRAVLAQLYDLHQDLNMDPDYGSFNGPSKRESLLDLDDDLRMGVRTSSVLRSQDTRCLYEEAVWREIDGRIREVFSQIRDYMPPRNFLDGLIEKRPIDSIEHFRGALSLFIVPAGVDKERLKEAFLSAVHLIAERWKMDVGPNEEYAHCLTSIGKIFLTLEEPELARDCQFLALNIGYESPISKNVELCRLVHIYKTFPRLLEQEPLPAREFIDALGGGKGLSSLLNKTQLVGVEPQAELSVEQVYRFLQDACREMRRDPTELRNSWYGNRDIPFGQIILKNPEFTKAVLFLNCIGQELPDTHNRQIKDAITGAILIEKYLNLHHDLNMNPDHLVGTKCLQECDFWKDTQREILAAMRE